MLLKEWIKQPLLIWITVYLSLHSRNKAHSTVVVVKLWIYENHMCELLSEELSEVWSFNFFFLSAFLFATAKVAYITAMIILHLILHSAVHIYDFHIFIISSSSSFYRYEPIQRPAPSWLVSWTGRTPHRYRRSQGFESRTSLIWIIFFRLSFRNCKSCV